MVLTEFRLAFLLERGAVAGGLGVHPVFGQPGNYEVPSGFTHFLPPLQYQLKGRKWPGVVNYLVTVTCFRDF